MIFLDTETCGLHGPIVLIQWAGDDGPVHLHEVWRTPVQDTLDLIQKICEDDVCGFNLAFDWFHLCQTYTTLLLIEDKSQPPTRLEYAVREPAGRDGPCLKPKGAVDLMLIAREGKYQTMMKRHPIRIKRVPIEIAYPLREYLDKNIVLDEILFAKKADPTVTWQIEESLQEGDEIPELRDIVLRFNPSSQLKAIVAAELDIDVTYFEEVNLSDEYRPNELGYAPFALAIGEPDNWNKAWPQVIVEHVMHWAHNSKAREYATNDVIYLQKLYPIFGSPSSDHLDSVLACMVGAVRWRGYPVDMDQIRALIQDDEITQANMPLNFRSPEKCALWLSQVLDPVEVAVLTRNDSITTKAAVLEEIVKWKRADRCSCEGRNPECIHCRGSGLVDTAEAHPAAERASRILGARQASKRIELLTKILVAGGRFHANFDVTGALSGRMSGGAGAGLNPQGVNKDTRVREAFTLSHPGESLCGGDWSGFEVSIADAIYKDPLLHQDLLSGKKIHGLLGVFLFPDMSYEEILATDGLVGDQDRYKRSKNGVFALLYGGNEFTLHDRVGVSEEAALKAYKRWCQRYVVWGEEREKYFNMFCSMRQPKGIGSKVEWHEPADFIESIFGWRRYFNVEMDICRHLCALGENPPKEWTRMGGRVLRRSDRGEQTLSGATRSALFGAAFGIQAGCMRAAANHVIQSPGATLTKRLQRVVWNHQPVGIHNWLVQPLNIHDEVLTSTHPSVVDAVEESVNVFVEETKSIIPLLGLKWQTGMKSWATK